MVAWGVGRGEGAEGARRRREGCRGLASDPHISGVYPVQAVIKSAAQIYLVAVIRTSGLHSYHHTPTPDKIKKRLSGVGTKITKPFKIFSPFNFNSLHLPTCDNTANVTEVQRGAEGARRGRRGAWRGRRGGA